MKAVTIIHLAIGLFVVSSLVCPLALLPQPAQAQSTGYQDGGNPEPSEKYSREELAQMLAPIALYPDALLSQILMAATYPIEVIEADRWVSRNPGLKGEALDAALLDKDWDPSVMAICYYPSILAMMSERITETTNLGNAFLAQEGEVMDTIQELRAKAYAQGNLDTTSEQKIIVQKETIIIEPADPRFMYVPYYDPFAIYGPWWYPAYPPYYWGPRGVSLGVGLSFWPGFYFGFAFDPWCHFDWPHHNIYIDVHKRPRYVRHDRWVTVPGHWQHVPDHRRGVAYRDKYTARRYGQSPPRPTDFRRDTRGFPEVLERNRDRRGDGRTVIDRNRQEQERRGRVNLDSQRPQRIDHAPQLPDRQGRAKVEPAGKVPQQKVRENVFNRVEDGRKEHVSGERGRVSRQGQVDDSRVRDGSGGDDRNERGRNWR